MPNKRFGFKLSSKKAIDVIQEVASNTYRNISGAIEFLLMKGYEQFQKEQNILNAKGDTIDKFGCIKNKSQGGNDDCSNQ